MLGIDWNSVLLGMLGTCLEFGVAWNARSLSGMLGICLEFWVAWHVWNLLGILGCLEWLEFAWNSVLFGMLGICL